MPYDSLLNDHITPIFVRKNLYSSMLCDYEVTYGPFPYPQAPLDCSAPSDMSAMSRIHQVRHVHCVQHVRVRTHPPRPTHLPRPSHPPDPLRPPRLPCPPCPPHPLLPQCLLCPSTMAAVPTASPASTIVWTGASPQRCSYTKS